MARLSERELAANIKSGRLENTYLFYGNEGYLKRLYKDRIIKKAVSDFADFNLHKFDRSVKMDDLVAACDSMPMMSEKSCVVLSDYNFSTAQDSEYKQLIELIEHPNSTCILILTYDNAEIPTSKTKKAKDLVLAVEKHGCVVNFEHKNDHELADIAIRRASKQEVVLQPTVARKIVETCGSDIENLLTEVDKLCAYVGKGYATEQDIDEVMVRTVEASAFALAGAVCSRRRDDAMKICADLFDLKTEPIVIIGALSSVFVDIYRVKMAENEGLRYDDIAQPFGYGKMVFKLKNAASYGRNMTRSMALDALEILRDADIKLKTSSSNGRVIVEKTLVRLFALASGEEL